jgi:hypothetical protein
MSDHLPEEFQYLVLFAVLSTRPTPFTKSELGIRISNDAIERVNKETGLLDVVRKGGTRLLSANKESYRWVEANLNTDLGTKKNKAVMSILHLIRAKTAAYLGSNHISIEDFLNPGIAESISPAIPAPPPTGPREPAAADVESVRSAYLAISGGAYDARVSLKELRERLHLDRDAQDAIFKQMSKSGAADFYPEDDPMSRNEEDDRASFVLGDRRRHIVFLHRRSQP